MHSGSGSTVRPQGRPACRSPARPTFGSRMRSTLSSTGCRFPRGTSGQRTMGCIPFRSFLSVPLSSCPSRPYLWVFDSRRDHAVGASEGGAGAFPFPFAALASSRTLRKAATRALRAATRSSPSSLVGRKRSSVRMSRRSLFVSISPQASCINLTPSNYRDPIQEKNKIAVLTELSPPPPSDR